MKKLIGAIGGACLLIGAQTAVASCPSGSDGLPNDMWYWVVGDTLTQTSFGDISYAGSSGNGWADVTVTTITQCIAMNPGDQPVGAHSTTYQTSVTTEGVKVCENSPNADDLAGELCR